MEHDATPSESCTGAHSCVTGVVLLSKKRIFPSAAGFGLTPADRVSLRPSEFAAVVSVVCVPVSFLLLVT